MPRKFIWSFLTFKSNLIYFLKVKHKIILTLTLTCPFILLCYSHLVHINFAEIYLKSVGYGDVD